ncbi:hypothetical protein BSZ35_05650 [Salinibacter sp. 10B]|uniref:BamA/TamA family outer membrane protein n=1 Tax=Salinibacter sp. 10B TaxID=1923971 RepID=UPI000D27020C|nr:BamA/TamA family outer membrane protein [Salinibacter sp. 10B]PQJ34154.1 hypothetical protein BSZ35_05650 [Salinibacter sp. 10B]
MTLLPGMGASAQGAQHARVQVDSTHTRTVYVTEQSTAEKILAVPSTLLHWTTRPIGWGVIWAERNEIPSRVEDFFWNDARTFGVFPTARLGGATSGAIGLTVRHEQLFGTRREAEARVLYSTPDNLRADAFYTNPAPFGEASFIDVATTYRLDSDENLFLTSDLGFPGLASNQRETSYRTEQVDLRLGIGANPRQRGGLSGLGWGLFARYERIDVGRGEGRGASRFPVSLPGVGRTTLVSTGASLLVEQIRGGRDGRPRTLSGRRFYLSYDFTHSLNDTPLSYHRLLGEWQRIVPLPVFGPYRRLVFRTRLEQLFPVPGAAVPFYKLPVLGSADLLRGAEQNRLRGDGTVLFTLEYRYPIWKTWDALLFVDSGQAFDEVGEIAPADFRWSAGMGVRVYAGSGVSLRLDVGVSTSGVRVFSKTGSSFAIGTRR